MTEWLKMVIEAEGYEVRTALIGTRGEEIFKQWRPDVVVTDLMLPDLDGVQLLRRLKEIDHSPEIIVISGQGTTARAVEAGQAGAFFFLENWKVQDGTVRHHTTRRGPISGPAGLGSTVPACAVASSCPPRHTPSAGTSWRTALRSNDSSAGHPATSGSPFNVEAIAVSSRNCIR